MCNLVRRTIKAVLMSHSAKHLGCLKHHLYNVLVAELARCHLRVCIYYKNVHVLSPNTNEYTL